MKAVSCLASQCRGLHFSLSDPQVFPVETPAEVRALWRAENQKEVVPVPRSLQGEQTSQTWGESRVCYYPGGKSWSRDQVQPSCL